MCAVCCVKVFVVLVRKGISLCTPGTDTTMQQTVWKFTCDVYILSLILEQKPYVMKTTQLFDFPKW